MKYILLVSLFISFSCSQPSGKSFKKAKLSDFQSIINEKDINESNLIADKFVEDPKYYRGSIKLFLYSDNRFRYQFKGSDEEVGDWHFDGNSLRLNAFYMAIPLQMHVFVKDILSKDFGLQFVDAQGVQRRDLKFINSATNLK